MTSLEDTIKVQEGEHGFSLIEMIVVLTILSIGAGIAVANVAGFKRQVTAESGLRSLFALSHQTRSRSIANAKTIALMVDTNSNAVFVANKQMIVLPAGLSLQVTTATNLVNGSRASILFRANGSSSGGVIWVYDQRGGTEQLRINWITGLPSIVKGDGSDDRS